MRLTKLISGVCALVLTGAALLAPSTAYSAREAAMIGHAWPNSALPCVQSAGSALENLCSGPNLVVIPIPFSSFKTFQVKARVRGGGTSFSTACRVIRWDDNNSGTFGDFLQRTSTSYGLMDFGSHSVSAGTFTVECTLGGGVSAPRGAVAWVDWI